MESQFSGYERLLTTIPRIPISPGPVIPPRAALPQDSVAAAAAADDGIRRREDGPRSPAPQVGNPVPARVPVVVRPIPWVNRFGFKAFLRLLKNRSGVSKNQAYANSRIVRVVSNLRDAVEVSAWPSPSPKGWFSPRRNAKRVWIGLLQAVGSEFDQP